MFFLTSTKIKISLTMYIINGGLVLIINILHQLKVTATVAQLVEQIIRNDFFAGSVFKIILYKSFLIPQNIQ